MSKQKPKPQKKKVVVTSAKKTATAPSSRRTSDSANNVKLEFGRQNYILMGAGAALIFLGLLLMSGGSMPSPEVWDDNIIYSTRRTVIAPFVILAGLVVEIYAIFKKA
jgi:hypothetical protein